MKNYHKKEKKIEMEKPELLAPAGSFEKAKTAFLYGADAIHCGTAELSLRGRAAIDDDDLAKTIEYAHSIGKKIYTSINIYAEDSVYDNIKKQVEMLNKLAVDAIIVSDGGVVDLIREVAPDIPIHISRNHWFPFYWIEYVWFYIVSRSIDITRYFECHR